MTMDNDFNVAGDPLLAYGAQTAGYPKIALTDGTKTSLTAKHTLTASLPDGTTGPVSIYNIEDGLKVTSDATVTNVAGTPDVLQFQFTKKKVCNHIRVNETAHDLAAAVIEVSDNGTAWTPISAKNIDEHDTYWDLEFTNNTGYFYYRVTLDDLTSIAITEVDIFLNDRTVKVQSSPDFGNGDNAGEVKFYTAAISGFDGTVTDVVAAGWTQITGTSDLGQSATELAVIDNGLVRVALDKNVAGAQKSAHIFVFNGTAWVSFAFSENANTEYTITSVETNTSSETAVLVDFNDGAATSQGRVTLQRGIPTSKWDLLAYGDVGGQDFRWMWDDSQARTDKWTYFSNDGATFASDSYGQVAPESFSPTGTDNFMSVPLPASGINAVVAVNTDEGFAIDRIGLSGFNYQNLLAGDLPLSIWLGAVPMDYTAPATLDAEIGNTDGQLIEAESYYAWEGETPLIGTNLLTNGGFETDAAGTTAAPGATSGNITGWLAAYLGGWEVIDSEKKFGGKCVEGGCSPSGNIMAQQVTSLEIDATYTASAWVRTKDAVGSPQALLRLANAPTGSNFASGTAIQVDKEWQFITVSWVATQSSVYVKLDLPTTYTSGTVQFDGIQLIKVKDADGTSALAFDTTSTDGWVAPGTASINGIVDGPRGKAIDIARIDSNSPYLLFSAQDFSQYREISFWVRNISGVGGAPRLSFYDGATWKQVNNNQTPIASAGEWEYYVIHRSSAQPANWADVRGIQWGNALGNFQIASFRLSKHNPAIGEKHGILHDMGDSEGLVHWSKLNDRDVTWLDDVVAWEGETPLIGENLIDNGDMETWTLTTVPDDWAAGSGTWSENTTDAKFGGSCAEVAGGAFRLDQNETDLEVGATYALTGWIRTVDATAGVNIALRVTNSLKTVAKADAPVDIGKEWTYATAMFTADESTMVMRLYASSSTGSVQFDGIQLIKVKNADGTSALAFDTTSTDGWVLGNGTMDVIDAPRGSGVRYNKNTAGSVTLEFDPADFSDKRYISFWHMHNQSEGITLRLTDGDGGFDDSAVLFPPLEWGLGVVDISTFTDVDLSNIVSMSFRSLDSSGYQLSLANFRLSKHNPAVGAKHGILHDMGDAEGLAFWWKGVEEQDVLQEDFQIDGDVLNGNFEAGSGATFTNWSNEGTPTLAEETSTQFAGTRSAKITASGAANEGLKQSFTATKAATYKVSAYAKATSGDTARLRIRNVTDATNPVDTTTTSTSWTRLSGSFTTVAGKVYEIQVLASADTDIVWFDDVELDVNLVVNPGFETYTTTPGPPDSWAVGSGTGTDWAKETTIVRSGSNAVKLVQTDAVTAPRITQTLSTTAGKSYYFEAWGRTGGNASDAPQARIFNTTDATTVLEPNSTPGGTTYEKLSGTFYAEAGKNYAVYLGEATGQVGTTVYFDDISVKEIVATDASGEDNHGTLRGATNTAGPTPGAADPFGGTSAVAFDGVDDYIQTPTVAATTDGNTSISAWVNATDISPASPGYIFGNEDLTMRLETTGDIRLDWRTGTGFDGAVIFGDVSSHVTSATWHHIVSTLRDDGSAEVYVDGVLIETGSDDAPLSMLDGPGYIGRNPFSSNSFFDGRIAGVRVYDRALGADEVAQRYNTRTHEAVAGWVVETEAVERLRLSSDSKESAKSLSYTAPDSAGPRYTYSSPQDWSSYKYLSGWFKSDNGADATLVVTEEDGTAHTGSAVANGVQVIGQVPGAWMHGAFDLDQFSTLDKTQIRTIGFVNVNAIGVTNHYLDGLKLTNFAETGDWVYAVEADADDGYIITNTGGTTTPASGDTYEVELYAPHAGSYDVSFFARAASGTPNLDVSIDGGSAISAAIASTAWSSQVAGDVNTVGPFTLSEGTHTVQFTTTSAVAVELTPRIALHESSLAYDGGAKDSSGESNDGAANDSGLMPLLRAVEDPFGGMGALAFDGVDDFIDVADDGLLSIPLTGSASHEFWFKRGALTEGVILSKASSPYEYGITINADDELEFTVWQSNGVNHVSFSTNDTITDTTDWHHVLVAYTSTASVITSARVYIDGQLSLEDLSPTTALTFNDTSPGFTIGARGDGGGAGNFDGSICGVRIYDRALGADEVAQRYNAGTHESVAGWVSNNGANLSLSTAEVKEGSKSLKMVSSGSARTADLTLPSPQDFSAYRYFNFWTKNSSGTAFFIRFTDADGNSDNPSISLNATGSWQLLQVDLSSLTGVDLTRITKITWDPNQPVTAYLDGIKLTSLEEVGDWRFTANTGASGGYAAQTGFTPSTTTLAAGDAITQPVVVPAAGDYYVGVMMQSTGGGGFAECSVAGVDSGTPQAIPTGSLATQENQVLFGPFTLTAGQKDVKIRVSTLGSMTTFVVDFIAIYPYQATTGTDIFPKDFSNSMLKDVNKIGSS